MCDWTALTSLQRERKGEEKRVEEREENTEIKTITKKYMV